MGEWKECLLNEIATYTTGRLNSNAEINGGEHPFFTCSPITLQIDKYAFDTEALILAGNNANGVFSLKYYKGKFNAYQRTYIISIKDLTTTSYRYLFYSLKTQLSNLENISHGTATKYLTLPILNQIPIKHPPLPEQKAIASVLSSLDDKIDLLHRQNKTLEAMAETLFRQWFIEKAEDDWEEKSLNEVLTTKGGSTPSTKNPEYWNGGVHWTTPRDLSNNNSIYLLDTARKISDKGLKKISSGLLPKGILLLSSRAPVGYLAFSEVPIAINQGYIAIIANKEFSKYFIYLWLKMNMDYVQSYANGSTFQEISKTSFKTLKLLAPPETIRIRFDKFTLPIFEKIKANVYQIQTLEKLRDTLLPKLMSGAAKVQYSE